MSDSFEEHIGGRGVVVREVGGGRVGLPPVVVVVEVVVVVVVVVVDVVVGRRFSKNSRISRTLFTRSHILEVILFKFSMMCKLFAIHEETNVPVFRIGKHISYGKIFNLKTNFK